MVETKDNQRKNNMCIIGVPKEAKIMQYISYLNFVQEHFLNQYETYTKIFKGSTMYLGKMTCKGQLHDLRGSTP